MDNLLDKKSTMHQSEVFTHDRDLINILKTYKQSSQMNPDLANRKKLKKELYKLFKIHENQESSELSNASIKEEDDEDSEEIDSKYL